MVKYMNDICMMAGVLKNKPQEDMAKVQSEIDHITSWANSHNLKLNILKTNGLIKYRGNFMEMCNVSSHIPSVNFLPCVRFLGVILEENLRWKSHVAHVMKKCTQRLYILRRMRIIATKDECLLIYKGLIRSLMEYACPAFIGLAVQD